MTGLEFIHPVWLLGLLLVPAILVLARRLDRSIGARRARTAGALRALAIACVVLAMADPIARTGGAGVDVVFVVDGSDSMGGNDPLTWVAQAMGGRGRDDRAAIVHVARTAQVEQPLGQSPAPPSLATVVQRDATDLEAGLLLARGIAGTAQRRRVVLLSDGRATTGGAQRAAAELAEGGITVDVVPFGSGLGPDVLVESVTAPGFVRRGQSHDVTATLLNTGDQPVDVTVVFRRNGADVDTTALPLPSGRTDVVIEAEATTSGTDRWEVEVLGVEDAIAANDTGLAAVRVAGPASVLVVEGERTVGKPVADALEAANLSPTLVGAGALPDLDALLAHDAVVLVDVPAAALTDASLVALDSWVRDAGRGLVLLGGGNSFGAGRWQDTVLEELSPVTADVQDPEQRPRVAEALVVDVSGSMAACHCRGEGFAGGGEISEGGVNKTEITKEAVARAVQALSSQDTVGVLAFSDTHDWILPLQQLPDQDVVNAAVGGLRPDGGTNVVPALREAIASLRDVQADLRHIVLFTDGFSENPNLLDVAREAFQSGITLSVVGTGEVPGDQLELMAEAGGGRYYPGRDLSAIPDIIVNEVTQVARPFIQEGEFAPTRSGADPVADELAATPVLLGYLATTAKATASVALRIGDFNDPLLARWQAGLGTVVAWTSDEGGAWAAPWVVQGTWSTFLPDLVASTMPRPGADGGFRLTATAAPEGIRLLLEADEVAPDQAVVSAAVVGPDGERNEVRLERTGATTWEATAGGGLQGITSATATVRIGTDVVGTVAAAAIRSWSAEYLPTPDDAGLLAAVAQDGGGVLDPDPATVFDGSTLAAGTAGLSLWPWLLVLAMLTVPVDVGVRRLRLSRDDLRALRRGRPAPSAEASATIGALRDRLRAQPRPPPATRTPAGALGADPPAPSQPTPTELPAADRSDDDPSGPTRAGRPPTTTPPSPPPASPPTRPDRGSGSTAGELLRRRRGGD